MGKISYEELQKHVRESGISSLLQYKKDYQSLPCDAPKHPEIVYRGKGWQGWGNFFKKSLDN